ncbi:MAG: hypothetical protein J0I82_02615 [Spirosoma sp.]|nr:hypothetical protein [Spirosoma sp.]
MSNEAAQRAQQPDFGTSLLSPERRQTRFSIWSTQHPQGLMDDNATSLNKLNYQPLHPHWVGLQTSPRDVLPVTRKPPMQSEH